jgi:hypothetical protein
MSESVHNLTVVPPTLSVFGFATPLANHACKVWRDTPTRFAASPVEYVFASIGCTSTIPLDRLSRSTYNRHVKDLAKSRTSGADFQETPFGAFLSDALADPDFESALGKLERCGIDNTKLLRWLWALVPKPNSTDRSLVHEASRLFRRSSDIGKVAEYAKQEERTELAEELSGWQQEIRLRAGIRKARSRPAVRGSDSDVIKMATWAVQRCCQSLHKHFAEVASILQHVYQAKGRKLNFDENQLRKLCTYQKTPFPKYMVRHIPSLAKSKNRTDKTTTPQ